MSLCRADNRRKAAKAGALAAGLSDHSEYELMLYRVAAFRRRLKQIKSTKAKEKVKKTEILPEMRDYCTGVMDAATGAQDDNLVYYLIWLFDAGLYSEFVNVAGYCVKHGLVMPEQFSSDLPGWVADVSADRTIGAKARGESLDNLCLMVWDIIEDADLLDIVAAKMYKAMALVVMLEDEKKALDLFRKALALNDRAGVKKNISALEKNIESSD